jgi:hypothetical protein
MAANMTDDLLNDDMDFMLSQVAENISFCFIEIENFRGEGKILKTDNTMVTKQFFFIQTRQIISFAIKSDHI